MSDSLLGELGLVLSAGPCFECCFWECSIIEDGNCTILDKFGNSLVLRFVSLYYSERKLKNKKRGWGLRDSLAINSFKT